jgi:hypothetical protein
MEHDPKDAKLDMLFAAARKAELYATERDYGFETRVMARIRAERESQKSFLVWEWRLIPLFVSLVIFLGIWIYASESRSLVDLSALTHVGNEEAVLIAYLTGE